MGVQKHIITVLLLGMIAFCCEQPFAEEIIVDSDMQFDYAGKNFDENDFNTALVEYKRFIHFFPQDVRIDQAQFRIGLCLYHLKRFRDAAKAFNTIILDENRYTEKSVFYQSQSFFKMGNTGYAKLVLINYLKLTETRELKDRLYSALSDLHVASFDGKNDEELVQAEKYLSMISAQGNAAFHRDLRIDTVQKAIHAPQKNPVFAGLFSIIPGAGFFYCERYQDGLVAFLLNIGLILAAYESFDQGNEALGGIITFVETGFYTGNIYGSITAAHQYNLNRKIEILGKKFDFFSKADIADKAWMIGLKHEF